ncbi:MAG: glycosyl transferase, group 1 [Frankiales bacterium]|nr:glycosyl transferase, group 1 [Frankiales bacterium]
MRSAVYNRYWTTGGGAETYGGAVASLLARRGPVALVGHEPFDPVALGERLALDLSGCTTQVVPHASAAVTAASRDVDLFVNVSHRSRDASAAPRSLYVVHFPTSLGVGGAQSSGLPRLEWGTGFHPPDGRTTWTDGDATLLVTTRPGSPVDVTLLLGGARPPQAGPAEVQVLVDGVQRGRVRLAGRGGRLERWSGTPVTVRVASPAPGVSAQVRVLSPSFVPAELLGADDARTLGVPVVGVALDRRARLTRRGAPVGSSTAWLDSYDALVANAVFTQIWVRRLWQRDSVVLHPPVAMRAAGTKERVVLGVGRFFPRGKGHSKKQRELVQAFRRLERPGWSLHLVGGCADDGRDYLETVRAEAQGLDVVLHPNASGAELSDLYARASVFWHAAGLDEDPEQHPDRLEHFGISTVEAMSAGAVPVVLRAGGLVESVRDGVDGVHVDDLDGFAEQTRALVDDPERLQRLSASAQERAREFSLEAFDVRLQDLLDALPAG